MIIKNFMKISTVKLIIFLLYFKFFIIFITYNKYEKKKKDSFLLYLIIFKYQDFIELEIYGMILV